MRKICPYLMAAVSLCYSLFPASAQLSFTSGVDAAAGPNADYAAVRFWNFSNSGGIGEFATGTGTTLYGPRYQTWGQQALDISFTYDPTHGVDAATVSVEGFGIGITIPSAPTDELQILVGNAGIGDLILTLNSINAVANGGFISGFAGNTTVLGGAENFAPGTTWSAANGTTLQAYLKNPALFSSAFTLNGTITLDAPANSTYYGDNLNSLIQFNLTSVPEPSTWALLLTGACLLGVFRQRRKI